MPGRIRFRYFLEGFDSSWSQPVAAREAVYTNLGPGSYRFRLVASNSEGLWNGPETAIALNVAPAYYQSYWFRLSCIAVCVALLWALYRWRIHQLETQEKRLRDVVETIPAMTFTALSDGSFTFVNKRWTEYTGLSVEKTLGAGWQRAIHPEDLVRHSEKWRISVATGQLFEDEARFHRAVDGEYRWFLVRGVPLQDQHANIVRWYGTLTDIEDSKRAGEDLGVLSRDLQESKAKLEEAQRTAHLGYWEWDLATGRVMWAEETYRIYGLQPREHPIELAEIAEMIHPEDREFVFRTAEEALRGGVRPDVEHRIVRPTGEVRIVHSQGDVKRDRSAQPYQMFGTVQDITERKRAEEALQQSQFYLGEGQRLAHMGSWALNPSGFFEYWSQELFKIYGLDPHQGAPTLELYLAIVHPQDRDFMADTIKRMLAERSGCDAKKRIVRPDGELRYIRCFGIPVVEDEVLKGFLGTAIDITEQELLTQELERRQANLSEAQILSHTGSFGWKPDTGEIVWSDETYRIFEYNPARKLTLDRIMERVHPEDRHLALEAKQASDGGGAVDFKLRLLFPEGNVKHIRVLVRPLGIAKDDLEFAGAVIDRTEAHLAEERIRQDEAELRLLIDAIPQQVAVFDSDWNPLFANRQAQEYIGLSPEEVPSIAVIDSLIHPDDLGRLHGNRKRATRETAAVETEARIQGKDGIYRWFLLRAYPLQDSQGHVLRWYATRTDISELKSAEQERERLRQLEADLAHTNRVSTLGEMAASLAHEIKQPIAAAITSANSCIEWLAHEPPNLDRARAAAAKVDKYGNRAAEIIDRIRSFYKKSPPQRELVDVNGVVDELLTLLKGEAYRFSVAMHTDLSTDLPKIMADRVQLQQVFMNLILNAIEAMKDSGGELTVKSELQDGQLQFSVTDSGVGLPMEKVDQIFSAFFTTKPQGSGMGLAISRSIVESHGGQLWACANSGGGASFHFTLPLQVTESSPLVA